MAFVPTPAVAGTNKLPVTPTPLNTPPDGKAERLIAPPFIHIDVGSVKVNGVMSFTFISNSLVDEHPSVLVNAYVIVFRPTPATAGSNEFPITPGPLNVPLTGNPARLIDFFHLRLFKYSKTLLPK